MTGSNASYFYTRLESGPRVHKAGPRGGAVPYRLFGQTTPWSSLETAATPL
jgi:hypothetical protein